VVDVTSKKLIVTKGLLFLFLIATSAGLIFLERPTVRTAVLLTVLIWASARFYYFLFYVLERYVDPRLRYGSLVAMVLAARRRPRS
jgi:hypothetical protein